MGFGILFLAYFMAFFVPLSYLHVIGYAGIAWALTKLKEYRPAFLKAVWWLIPLGACCLYHVAGSVTELLPYFGITPPDLPVFGTAVNAVVTMIECALTLCFHFVFLRQLNAFARELELTAIAKRADWGLWLVSVQVSTYVVALALELAGVGLQLLSLLAFLLQFVWAIFNLVNLFTCYMYICPEGDEDMERKPSKFAFVNNIREKMDERDRLAREREAAARDRKKKKKK